VRQILPGGEPFFFPGGQVGCLLTHGFTATPQEMRRLGEHLAGQGYTVLGVRLFGHATHLEDLARAHWRDWLASIEDGFHLLTDQCTQVVVAGLSMGGALSLLLATRFPVAGVVALSTLLYLPLDPRLKLLRPILRPLSLVLPYIPKGPPDWVDPQAARERVAYSAYPLRAVLQLEGLLSEMRHKLPEIHVPVLLMHSKNDHFVTPDHMPAIYEQLGTTDKAMTWVENSGHIISCDADRQAVFAATSEFISRVTGQLP
jgi:carboxylesterase